MTLALTLVAAVAIGVTLGLLGGGGSILTVPILVYVAGLPAKEAIATSLFVVAVTAAFAALPHARAGRLRWRTGTIFGAAAMTGAYTGGRIAEYLPGQWLLAGFGLMMLATAAAMLRGRRTPTDRTVPHELPIARVLLDGTAVGLITGLVGAGGGFLVVPALALLGGLPITTAIATSLLVITMNSTAGLLGHLHSVHLNWNLALAVTTAAVAGSLLGSRLAGKTSPDTLRKAFGWLVLAMATAVLLQQAPDTPRHWLLTTPPGWATLTATATITAGTAVLVRRQRHRATPTPPADPQQPLALAQPPGRTS